MKKILAAVLVLLTAVGVFSGCNLVEADDGNVVIATVNGVSILKSDYNEIYNYWYYYLVNSYGYTADQATQTLEGMSSDILEQLIEEELIAQMAEKDGFLNYTQEDRDAAAAVINEDKQSYIESLVTQYKNAFEGQEVKGKNEGESDEDYFYRIAEQKYYKNLEDNGVTEEEMIQEQLKTAALEKYQEDKMKDVTVLESDIVTEYEEQYNTQLEALSTDSAFVSAWNESTYKTLVYYRAGYSLVQHILISFEEEDQKTLQAYAETIAEYDEEINDYTADIEEETDEAKKAEYQQLLDRAKEEQAEYQQKYEEALTAAKAKIQDQTDEVYASVKDADEDTFISVMVEKTGDTGMKDADTAKKGYLVGPEDNMAEEFSQMGQSLEAGQIGEPVATYYGYHIIRCIKKLNEGKVPYEDVKEEIQQYLTETKKEEEWTAMIETWKTEAKIKKYPNKL